MITGQLSGQHTPQALRDAMGGVDSALERAVVGLCIKMQSLVKDKLSGEVLRVRTGRLRRSITYRTETATNQVTGIVGTNVEYAKTHELGLTIPAHIVEARRAKALRFTVGGKVLFRRRVLIPAKKMPRRSFLEASLRQMAPQIQDTLAREVMGEVQRVFMRGVGK